MLIADGSTLPSIGLELGPPPRGRCSLSPSMSASVLPREPGCRSSWSAELGKRRPQALQACFLNSVSSWSSCQACPRESALRPQIYGDMSEPLQLQDNKDKIDGLHKVTG